MALVNKAFSVSVAPGMMPPVIHVSEYDIGRSYTVQINGENGGAFTIPTGTTASIEGTLNGSVGFTQSASISNNQVSFTLSESMTAYSGRAWCKIKLTLNSEPIQTCAFVLAVDRAGVEAETVIGSPGFEEQIVDAVNDWLDEHPPESGGVTEEVKQALLNCFNHVWWTDGNGQQYYDALYAALYPPAHLVSISAVFTQGNAVIYNTDSLDSLKQYLTVTARFSDSTVQTISNYTLTGTLVVGTSTITAHYGGKSATFTVQVTKDPYVINITESVMSRGKGLTLNAPDYSQDAGSMVSYLGFDLMLEPSKNYQIEWDCNAPTTASIGAKVYNQAAITQANNGENITYANQRDLGQWFDYGSPISFSTSATEGCIRFQIRENGSQAITSGFEINYLRVKEVS